MTSVEPALAGELDRDAAALSAYQQGGGEDPEAARERFLGSEAATMSNLYGYRRSDFAYRFLHRLDGEDPELAEDPADRDRLHDLLLTAGTS
jgi:hypothetical protein